MKTFEVSYTIGERESWRSKDGLQIKSNIADDKLVECDISQSLVDHLKEQSALFDPDKFLLTIAEAQKREIASNIEAMEDMALQMKVHSDKTHQIVMDAADEAESKYLEIEKKFSDTQDRFTEKMQTTAIAINSSMKELTSVEEKLSTINQFSLERLTKTINSLLELVKLDPDLVKMVLDHKNSALTK
jgi:uncharacterized protein YukE